MTQKDKEPLSIPQMFILVNHAREPIKSLIAFLYVTASRISEVVKVFKPEDVILLDYKEGIVVLRLKVLKNPKQKHRYVYLPMNDPFLETALNYIATKQPGSPVWNFSRQYAYSEIRKLGWFIGRKDLHPHLFRHSRLTHLALYQGFSESMLQAYVGWANTQQAQRYVNVHARQLVPHLKGMINTYKQIINMAQQ